MGRPATPPRPRRKIGRQILDGAARRLAEIIEVMLREADAG